MDHHHVRLKRNAPLVLALLMIVSVIALVVDLALHALWRF